MSKTQASAQAHQKNKDSGRAETQRARILNQCKARTYSGVSIHFIELVMGIKKSTATARLSELQETGQVYAKKIQGDKYTSYFYEPDARRWNMHARDYNIRINSGLKKKFLNVFGSKLTPDVITKIQNIAL